MEFADIENAGKELLAANPQLRHAAKSLYHHVSYALSDKSVKCEGEVVRVSPDDEYEYFFGYYDKSPWSADGRFMLCMRARCTNKEVAPKEPLDILLLDCEADFEPRKIATSYSWNVQQGCMAQWLGPDFNSKVIYNDYRDGSYCSVILDAATLEERVLPVPVYAVSSDGDFALTLDFSRLHRLRPGYGYANLPDSTVGQLVPSGPCIWRMDLATGDVAGVLGYADFASFEPREEMVGAEHKVNHIMINPSGTRFMVLHRWYLRGKKYTRLVTANVDGSGLFNLSDDDFVSHCFWKNDREIISFMRRNDRGNHYYLFKDGEDEYRLLWPELKSDGHCSYSPDCSHVITDTYPNRKRLASIYLCREDLVRPLRVARVFAPFSYDFDTRCDLHPRWDRKGEHICFDSVHEGKRRLYVLDVRKSEAALEAIARSNAEADPSLPKICFVITSYRNTGPMNQTLYLARGLKRDGYGVAIVSIFREKSGDSVKSRFDALGIEQVCLGLDKKKSLLAGKSKVTEALTCIKPDVVHAVGMPPYAMTLGYSGGVPFTVVRNYCREDYPAKYGAALGAALASQDIGLMKRQVSHGLPLATCSESLAEMYRVREGIELPSIPNGVDTDKFRPDRFGRLETRAELGIGPSDVVLVYSGQFNERKNQRFAIEAFLAAGLGPEKKLLLLGDGPQLEPLKAEFGNRENLIFAGAVDDVPKYLNCSDAYVSASKSEGMPNGVLEAMACGLPVTLSDIPQHREVVRDGRCDFCELFSLDSFNSAAGAFRKTVEGDLGRMGENARAWAVDHFSADRMIKNYEAVYSEIYETTSSAGATDRNADE